MLSVALSTDIKVTAQSMCVYCDETITWYDRCYQYESSEPSFHLRIAKKIFNARCKIYTCTADW